MKPSRLEADRKVRRDRPEATRVVAALFVQARGVYVGDEGIDPWPESRDARLYRGPHPVVAHPPCTRWCRLAGLVEARWGHKRGDDGGTFASALASVRSWGGVLEHPAHSAAWKAFGLAKPPNRGGWVPADDVGGWTCHVEQGRYGHAAKKATWLYAVGADLPRLRWGCRPDRIEVALVSWCGNMTKAGDSRRRLSKREASSTPPEFQAILLRIARSVGPASGSCPALIPSPRSTQGHEAPGTRLDSSGCLRRTP